MRHHSLLVTLLTAILGLGLSACSRSSKEDKVLNVEETDPEMNAAIAKAREFLPSFWQVFEQRGRGEEGFSLKVKITDSHGTEHFWATDIEKKGDKVFGTINNDPEIVKNTKIGDRIQIPEADVTDWLYLRADKMVGNYTLRVLFKQMPAKEVEFYKQRMAEP